MRIVPAEQPERAIRSGCQRIDVVTGLDEGGFPRKIIAGKTYRDAGNGQRVILSQSESHGGFDNDPATLNSVLERILGRTPTREFRSRDLQY